LYEGVRRYPKKAFGFAAVGVTFRMIAAYALDFLMASLLGDFFNNIGAKRTLVGAFRIAAIATDRHSHQYAASCRCTKGLKQVSALPTSSSNV